MTSPTSPSRQWTGHPDSNDQAVIEAPIGAVTDADVLVSVDLSGAVTPTGQVAYDAVLLRSGTNIVPIPVGSVNGIIGVLEAAREHAHRTGVIA